MNKTFLSVIIVLLSVSLFAGESDPAPKPILKKGARIAIIGDSITEQKLYSRYMEMYLTACLSHLNLNTIQFGWGGERAAGFAKRMDNDLMPFKPDIATTCFGMNDGGCQKYKPGIGAEYEKWMTLIVKRLKEANTVMVVGSPGAVDTFFFKSGNITPEEYNENLNTLGGISKKLAVENGFNFANVHQAMLDAMVRAKAALGENYDVCGRDGYHPGGNGHLLMAQAFLKGLGIDGQIGTITVDMKGNAQATEGHKVLSAFNGKIELESVRWPYCFSGDEKSSGGTRSILPYCTFNQDLNRYILIVKNLAGEKAKVTWGADGKVFTRVELEKGVNLTEHFFVNPFLSEWNNLEKKVLAKQEFEKKLIKEIITRFPDLSSCLDGDKEADAVIEALRKKLMDKHAKLVADVRAAVLPVKHTLVIAAEK